MEKGRQPFFEGIDLRALRERTQILRTACVRQVPDCSHRTLRDRIVLCDPSDKIQPKHDSQHADFVRSSAVVRRAKQMAEGKPEQRSEAAKAGELRRTPRSAQSPQSVADDLDCCGAF
jgi:hypothetical protein